MGQCGLASSSRSYGSTAIKNGSGETKPPWQRSSRPNTNTVRKCPMPNPILVHALQQMSCRWAMEILLPRYRHTLCSRTSHPKPLKLDHHIGTHDQVSGETTPRTSPPAHTTNRRPFYSTLLSNIIFTHSTPHHRKPYFFLPREFL
jgi:hypothetical protein